MGNLYRTRSRSDRRYGPSGRLLETENSVYHYDEEGNIGAKVVDHKDVWLYNWNENGSLKEVIRPDKKKVSFEYDALGRRTAKIFDGRITRFLWDGNTPLHEWQYKETERPQTLKDEFGFSYKDKEEPVENVTTWVFEEGTFRPAAKLTEEGSYSIITDYLGTPAGMYNEKGEKCWQMELDIYGKVRTFEGSSSGDCPFRYPGQYEDTETGLYYNRFRYYAPEEGLYLSQDPIGLAGGNPTLYGYVYNPHKEVDYFGTDIISDAWKVAVSNINNSGLTLLGHMSDNSVPNFESYIDKAIRKGGSYFSIGSMWNDVAKTTDPWILNQKFLDVVADRGDKIILNVTKNNIRPGSYLQQEVDYLTQKKGYKWVNQWSLKKCK